MMSISPGFRAGWLAAGTRAATTLAAATQAIATQAAATRAIATRAAATQAIATTAIVTQAIVTLAIATLAVVAWPSGSARAQAPCPGSPTLAFQLPHLRAALAAHRQAVIVALGSSSTEGVMASDPAHSYPAVLQARLARALPGAHFVVLNRGIGGQDAPEELARLDRDVIAVRPQLVVWQVGANGAMRHADPAVFAGLVTQGVQRLQAAGIDVVLMDNQHCPKVDATAEGVLLDRVLGKVAAATGVNLFSRAALMDRWAEQGEPVKDFISRDGLHHNDLGYACIAGALARDIAGTLQPATEIAASR